MMPKLSLHIAVIDNYDSFTYNLVHAVEPYVSRINVMRNDEIDEDILNRCDAIILSPGPGLPQEAGEMPRVISEYVYKKPFLGICLGMQALHLHFGGRLVNMSEVMHGRSVKVKVNAASLLFRGISENLEVGLYHSWCCKPQELPKEFKVTAHFNDIPMALEHRSLPVFGVQFHPESIMTKEGGLLLLNWLRHV